MNIGETHNLRDIAAAHGSLLQGIAALVTACGGAEHIVNQGAMMVIKDAAVEIANNAVNASKMLLMELEPVNEASQAVDSSARVTDSDDDEEDDDDDDDDDEGCGHCGVLGCEGECVDGEEEEEEEEDSWVDDAEEEEEGGGIQGFVKGAVWMYDVPANLTTVEIVSVDREANTCVVKSIDPDDFQRIYTDVPLNALGH